MTKHLWLDDLEFTPDTDGNINVYWGEEIKKINEDPKQNFEKFKEFLAGTEEESLLNENNPHCYLSQYFRSKDGKVFVSFKTGCNNDQVISFTVVGDHIYTRNGYIHNYGNYSCSCNGSKITERVNYSFGGDATTTFDFTFEEIDHSYKENWGCCCG